jgi:hypothetical protein
MDRIVNTKNQLLTLVLFGLALISGCKSIADMVHTAADWIDPNCVDCSSPIPNCTLCGQSMAGPTSASPPYPIAPDGGCPHCGGIVPSPSGIVGDPAPVQAQLAELREETMQTKGLVDKMSAELSSRNEALIQSRADYARVEGEIEAMRSEVLNWQQQAVDVHERMRQRDAERQAALGQLKNSLADLVEETRDAPEGE